MGDEAGGRESVAREFRSDDPPTGELFEVGGRSEDGMRDSFGDS